MVLETTALPSELYPYKIYKLSIIQLIKFVNKKFATVNNAKKYFLKRFVFMVYLLCILIFYILGDKVSRRVSIISFFRIANSGENGKSRFFLLAIVILLVILW